MKTIHVNSTEAVIYPSLYFTRFEVLPFQSPLNFRTSLLQTAVGFYFPAPKLFGFTLLFSLHFTCKTNLSFHFKHIITKASYFVVVLCLFQSRISTVYSSFTPQSLTCWLYFGYNKNWSLFLTRRCSRAFSPPNQRAK